MDFSSLPDEVFLKIFRMLSLEDRVRVGRVCPAFRRISITAVSETKCLEVNRRMTPFCLSNFLKLCSNNLEKISFASFGLFSEHDKGVKLIRALCTFSCPKLTEIDIGGVDIGTGRIRTLLMRNQNLRNFTWYPFDEAITWPRVTHKKVEKLTLGLVDGSVLRPLGKSFPNLKHIDVKVAPAKLDTIDHFFLYCSQLETLTLTISKNVNFDRSRYLWRLNSLSNLSLDNSDNRKTMATDITLKRIASSFPLLTKLELGTIEATNSGIAALATLENLRSIKIWAIFSRYLDEGIRQFSKCKFLEEVRFSDSEITATTLINLFRSCPQLSALRVNDICEVETNELMGAAVRSLAEIGRRIDITLDKEYDDDGQDGFYPKWCSEFPHEILEEVNQDGCEITFTLSNYWD